MPPRRRPAKTAAFKTPARPKRSESDDDEEDVPPLVHQESEIVRSKPDYAVDDDDDDTGCLHCHTSSAEIQVRCDECSSYICDSCHWCHEFQANHEIRVCDRCDAFYCRQCDEMDQCDDCGEVVCSSCSTLLSCKFCGGGLCEECATACGRCGIVLCSRDAKFAVDCDTCRLSYCLVCLASGSKDPCVRCGHRPSKRMEQLVHLRLKSIYKAFKQSSTGAASGSLNASAPTKASNTRERQNDDPDEDHVADDPETLFQAAASAAKLSGSAKHSNTGTATLGDARHYVAEQEKADAAAAALLAELEEEEEAAKSKKKKKKKKKVRQQQKNENDNEPVAEDMKTNADPPLESVVLETSTKDEKAPPLELKAAIDTQEMSKPSPVEKSEPASVESSQSRHNTTVEAVEVDPLDTELDNLIAAEDVDGIEELLATVKGVPGRAALRKNAKKAMKRIRAKDEGVDSSKLEQTEASTAPPTDSTSSVRSRVETPVAEIELDARVSELLKVISHTHNKMPSQPSGNSSRSRSGGAARSECVMHMVPTIVGWVIGKGGQRIRDLMEESGARIWIDQDSKSPTEPRVVYVSGHKNNVDSAVRMIEELVAKAPAGTPQSKQNTPVADASENGRVASSGRAPAMPDASEMMKSNDGIGLKMRVTASSIDASPRPPRAVDGADRSRHMMTCDPRFVPLLIGRRGWTIKHIQDSSGARVDIDQSVTPRRITISGSNDQVQHAIEMVRDVLSYPQAQLQGRVDAEGCATSDSAGVGAPSPVPKQEVVPNVSSPILSPMNDTAEMRSHTPPPSSLIMTGDAKSTISASSSLSSTPEPSMASSKGPSVFPPVSLLPPVHDTGPHGPGPSDTSQGLLYPMPPQNLPRAPMFPPASHQAPPSEQYFFPSQQPPAPMHSQAHSSSATGVQPRLSMPPRDLVSRHQQPFHMRGDPVMFPSAGQAGLHHVPAVRPNVLPVSDQNVFHSPQPRYMQQPNPSAEAQMLSHMQKPVNGGLSGGPGLWEQQSGAPRTSVPMHSPCGQESEGFRLDAAVAFLQNTAPVRSTSEAWPSASATSSSNGFGGLSSVASPHPSVQRGFERSTTAPSSLPNPSPLPNPSGIESQMVDSLFGPDGSSDNGNLLGGLKGLSLGNESIGLWGASSVPVGPAQDTAPSSLFGTFQPTVVANDQVPSHSRFAWGGSSEG